MTTPRVRLATIVQDLTMFVLPSIVTAMIITRQPSDFLLIRHSPRIIFYLLAVATLCVSVPAMEWVIKWNSTMSLPESMSWLDEWMHDAEANSAKMVESLIGGKSIGSLIMSIMIVGILAGFSEELLFRGTLQRLMVTSGINVHLSIWLAACVFSAMHLQFFGFVPRMLLGAYFGYLVYFTRSLWPAIFAHVANNTIAVYDLWHNGSETTASTGDIDVLWAATSGIATICLIMFTAHAAKISSNPDK